jgi:acetyltransferase
VSTRDGTEYFIRPIVPEDAEREIAFVRSLSTESRYKRLMYGLREPSRAMVEPYVNVDYDRHMALIALHGVPGHEQIIGVARYASDDGGGAHEFAVVVTDEWQGRGVGTRLLEDLFEYARAHGVRRLYGQVLHDNVPMLSLARKLGFSSGTCPDGPRLVTITLEMGARP